MRWIHTTVETLARSYLTLTRTEYDPETPDLFYPLPYESKQALNPIEYSQDFCLVMTAYQFARRTKNNELLLYYRDLLLLVRIYLYELSEESDRSAFHNHARFAWHLHIHYEKTHIE